MKRKSYINAKQVKTQYKYVRKVTYINNGIIEYCASVPTLKKSKTFSSIKEAAIAVDKWFLEAGKPPVNILKKL